MIPINQSQIRICEECLYIHKDLPRRIADLEAYIDSIMPVLPGSVLKLVGRPVAKTPLDTSQVERWAIKRATCNEAAELSAKKLLYERLNGFLGGLREKEARFVRLVYDREIPTRSVVKDLGITYRTYYRTRKSVLIKSWEDIGDLENILELGVK